MNRTKGIKLLCCLLVLITFMTACSFYKRTKVAGNQTFSVQDGDTLTNGTINYTRLPEGWHYGGEYLYRIGKVKGGRGLLSSDENGTIVKEMKPLLADMDYAPWIREDAVLPELCSEDMEVEVSVGNIKSKNWVIMQLDRQARDEFITWLKYYSNNHNKLEFDKIGSLGIPHLFNNPRYRQGSVYLHSISTPGLYYDGDFRFIIVDRTLYMVSTIDGEDYVIGSFDEGDAFYQAVDTRKSATVELIILPM